MGTDPEILCSNFQTVVEVTGEVGSGGPVVRVVMRRVWIPLDVGEPVRGTGTDVGLGSSRSGQGVSFPYRDHPPTRTERPSKLPPKT